MERKITKFLLKWKEELLRKPLVIFGGKQVGKTYSALQFGKNYYSHTAYFNTNDNLELLEIFRKERSIDKLAILLSELVEVPIEKHNTLLIFDNVNDEDLIKGLKLFGYSRNDYHVIAITSNREIIARYRSEELQYKYMTEMDFEEYLWAIGEEELAKRIRYSYANKRKCSMHTKALDLFYNYLLTGGFPEVIKAFCDQMSSFYQDSKRERIFDTYVAELASCSNLIDIKRGIEVLNSIPRQLKKENKKFQYGLLGQGSRAKEYENVIKYLVSNQLVYRSYKVSTIKSPLSSCRELDSFKLYYPDDGLLCGRLHLTKNKLIEDDNVRYAVYENHIAHTLVEAGYALYYYQSQGKAEVNFVIQNRIGQMIPIEISIKKGSKTKSLSVFMKNFTVFEAYRITENNFSVRNGVTYLPIYAIFCLNEQLY